MHRIKFASLEAKTPAQRRREAETAEYQNGHCAGFCGWPADENRGGYAQCEYDRGYWDGSKARERALQT
jgi:hypothetical protein